MRLCNIRNNQGLCKFFVISQKPVGSNRFIVHVLKKYHCRNEQFIIFQKEFIQWNLDITKG